MLIKCITWCFGSTKLHPIFIPQWSDILCGKNASSFPSLLNFISTHCLQRLLIHETGSSLGCSLRNTPFTISLACYCAKKDADFSPLSNFLKSSPSFHPSPFLTIITNKLPEGHHQRAICRCPSLLNLPHFSWFTNQLLYLTDRDDNLFNASFPQVLGGFSAICC